MVLPCNNAGFFSYPFCEGVKCGVYAWASKMVSVQIPIFMRVDANWLAIAPEREDTNNPFSADAAA